jgi:TolB protein
MACIAVFTRTLARIAVCLSAVAAFSTLAAPPAQAQDAPAAAIIDVTRGHMNPYPIAAPDFVDAAGQPSVIGGQIAQVVRDNLTRSGLFRVIDQGAHLERITDINTQPRFGDWATVQAQGLLVGSVTELPDGRVRIAFRLWDVTGQVEMETKQYGTTPENWRRVAHRISDAVYERLTGEGGYFDTRIVFVSESGPKIRRVKQLMIMDQDGANPSLLFQTGPNALFLTPRFSPEAQMITYLSFETGRPRVFLLNIESGRREVLGTFDGMAFAPRFSPDGQRVIFTRALNGNSDIFEMNLRTRAVVQLTRDPGIDTGASYAPDGSQIVFESDRAGGQALYVMAAGGGPARRISGGDGRYGTPVWSPRGDLIAFTKQSGGRFSIGVIRPDGAGERILTSSNLEEGPTWSPNGRVIMFTRTTNGRPKLMSVDLTGQNLREAPTPADASDPAWSPSLP